MTAPDEHAPQPPGPPADASLYPAPEQTLRRWVRENLLAEREPDGGVHYRYRYLGTTCRNGGAEFEATMHVVLDGQRGPEALVRRAWVDFDETQKDSARRMCAAISDGGKFLRRLAREDGGLAGWTLEQFLAEGASGTPGGCFCTSDNRLHKWRQAAATIHYARGHGLAAPGEASS
jgi:hypothetical protein